MDADRRFMTRALELATRGTGHVHPNPLVGAVVVSGGEVVGEGWHARFGGAHAEVTALESAGARSRGATLYVTLEPCSHHGKTPPCVDAIIGAGVARVVAAGTDPDPRVNGSGLEALRAAGLDVREGVLGPRARALDPGFFQLHREGRSLVTLKLAHSLDGRIAARGGASRWISSPASRREVHRLRSAADAVLVGRGTAERDDPSLTVREVPGRNPVRIVVDSEGRVPSSSKLFGDGAASTVHATLADRPSPGGEHWELPPGPDGRVDLLALLGRAAHEGLLSVLVEGGAGIATALLSRRLVDGVHLFSAPIVLGSNGSLAWAGDIGDADLDLAPRFRVVSAHVAGGDVVTVAIAPSHPSFVDAGAREIETAGVA